MLLFFNRKRTCHAVFRVASFQNGNSCYIRCNSFYSILEYVIIFEFFVAHIPLHFRPFMCRFGCCYYCKPIKITACISNLAVVIVVLLILELNYVWFLKICNISAVVFSTLFRKVAFGSGGFCSRHDLIPFQPFHHQNNNEITDSH